eukprot:6459516-Amphidinium_carterae.1
MADQIELRSLAPGRRGSSSVTAFQSLHGRAHFSEVSVELFIWGVWGLLYSEPSPYLEACCQENKYTHINGLVELVSETKNHCRSCSVKWHDIAKIKTKLATK